MSRRLRAACDFCHRSKIKCSGGQQCSSCNSLNITCLYSYTKHTGRPRGARNKKTLERIQQFQGELDLRSINDPAGQPSDREMTTFTSESQSTAETSALGSGPHSYDESLLYLQSDDSYLDAGDPFHSESGRISALDDGIQRDLEDADRGSHSDSALIPDLLSPAVPMTVFQPIVGDVEQSAVAQVTMQQIERIPEHEHPTFETLSSVEHSDISSLDMLTDMSGLDLQLPRSDICHCISKLSLALSRLATSSYMAQAVHTLEDTLSSTRAALGTMEECFECHCHSAGPRMVVLLLLANSISLIANIISNQCTTSGHAAAVLSDATWPNVIVQPNPSPRRLSDSYLLHSSLRTGSGVSGPKFEKYQPTMREERLMRSALLLNAIDQACCASRRLLQLASNHRLSLQSSRGLRVEQASDTLLHARLPSTVRLSSTIRRSETTVVQGLQYICETMEQTARDMSRQAEDFAIFNYV